MTDPPSRVDNNYTSSTLVFNNSHKIKKSLVRASIPARGAIFLLCFLSIINTMGIMDCVV